MDQLLKFAQAEAKLSKADPILGRLIKLQKPVIIESRKDYFASLCRSIVGQQISVRAAAAIFERLGSLTKLSPEVISNLGLDKIKTVGLSGRKAAYIFDLAVHFRNNSDVYNHLDQLSDDEVVTELTAVKGIGVWTSQMFLMFSLGRLDVFPVDDVGIQRAMKLLYHWEKFPIREDLIKVSDAWRPYRTLACLHLWKSLRNEPA
jgi:DNA-3-methyladenine glycosylase II